MSDNLPEISSEIISDSRVLKRGDQLAVQGKRNGMSYYHHGIFLGHEKGVVDTAINKKPDTVDIMTFKGDRQLFRINYPNGGCLPSEDVAKAAEHWIKNCDSWKEYNLFSNNCEHFATFCKIGTKVSYQVNQQIEESVKKALVGATIGGAATCSSYGSGSFGSAQPISGSSGIASSNSGSSGSTLAGSCSGGLSALFLSFLGSRSSSESGSLKRVCSGSVESDFSDRISSRSLDLGTSISKRVSSGSSGSDSLKDVSPDSPGSDSFERLMSDHNSLLILILCALVFCIFCICVVLIIYVYFATLAELRPPYGYIFISLFLILLFWIFFKKLRI